MPIEDQVNLKDQVAKKICKIAGVDFDRLPEEFKRRNLKASEAIITLVQTELQKSVSSPSEAKENKLMDYLKEKGPMTPRDIYRNLNMSAAELVRVTKPLIQMGLVNNCKIGKHDGLMIPKEL
jgi:predicted transcriptional regulator